MSLTEVQGKSSDGSPCGNAPTVLTARSSSAVASVAQEDEEGHDPEDQRRGIRLIQAGEERSDLVDEAVRIRRKAEQFRQLADDDRDREPVHVPDLHLLREQVRNESELREPEADLDRPDDQRHHARQHDGGRRIPAREGDDRGEDERRDRRVRPQDQDA
jgi:hypothetical protein